MQTPAHLRANGLIYLRQFDFVFASEDLNKLVNTQNHTKSE